MAATIIRGDKRVTVPENIRRELGLEDGVEYVVGRSSEEIGRPSVPERNESAEVAGATRATQEQIEALDRMLASRRHFTSTRVLADDEWDEAIARAIIEDFQSEDYGEDAGGRG